MPDPATGVGGRSTGLRFNGYHDDYACVVNGLIDLYEITFDLTWLEEAGRLIDVMVERTV